MKKIAKVDGNQKQVVTSLRKIPGVSVAITSQLGSGFPDIVVGHKGFNYLIELKDGSKPPSGRRLTDDEKQWHVNWKGQVSICNDFDEVLNLINIKCQ